MYGFLFELCRAMLRCRKKMERAMGFEPTTSCLGSKHSTPELRPLNVCDYTIIEPRYPCILMGGAEPPFTGNEISRLFPRRRPGNQPNSISPVSS